MGGEREQEKREDGRSYKEEALNRVPTPVKRHTMKVSQLGSQYSVECSPN